MGAQTDRRWIILAVFAVIAGVIVAVVLISGGDDSDGGGSSTAASAAGGCKQVEAPEPKSTQLPAPKQTVK